QHHGRRRLRQSFEVVGVERTVGQFHSGQLRLVVAELPVGGEVGDRGPFHLLQHSLRGGGLAGEQATAEHAVQCAHFLFGVVEPGSGDPHRFGFPRSAPVFAGDRKSTRLNSSHVKISYAVFCLKKKCNVSKFYFCTITSLSLSLCTKSSSILEVRSEHRICL